MRRKETPLCMALLDIDNFKKINDTLGHSTGDQALAHLAQVARECMRPQDTLARYGGEEFVLMLPDTPLEKGIEAMVRLQRELTKRFFLSGAEKILITFSAGVAQVGLDEDGAGRHQARRPGHVHGQAGRQEPGAWRLSARRAAAPGGGRAAHLMPMKYWIRYLATNPTKPKARPRNITKVPNLPALDSQASWPMMNSM
jgi:hypothetical protein